MSAQQSTTNFTVQGMRFVHISSKYCVRKRSEARSFEVEFARTKGIWKSLGTKNLDEVEEAVSKILAHQGQETISGMQFKTFAEKFFVREDKESIMARNKAMNHNYERSWYLGHQGRLDNYLMPQWGESFMQDITDTAIEDWYIYLERFDTGEPLSDNSKIKILTTLSVILKEAKRKKLISDNPCDHVEKITQVHKKREPFTQEEVEQLFPEDLEELERIWGSLQYALFFSIMVDTGMRCGEVSALKKSNFVNGGVYTKSSVDFYTGKEKASIKTTHKGQDYKAGILSSFTQKLLASFAGEMDDDEYLFFIKTRKGLNLPDTSNRVLKLACERAGIDRRGRTQHCFRHFFDTYMLNNTGDDISSAEVRELMAHTKYRPEYDHRTAGDTINRLEKIKPIIDRIRA